MSVRTGGLGGMALILLAWAALGQRAPYAAEGTLIEVPLGLDLVITVPEDNALTRAKVDLGRRLFFDPMLSQNQSMSCASCHPRDRYFTDGRNHALGIYGREGRRNVPSLLNVGYGRAFFWDGRARTLEEQVLQPIANPLELNLDQAELERRLERNEIYRSAFRGAFPDGRTSAANAARALASYLRTLRSGNAPIDRYSVGDIDALSPEARHGLRIFTGKGNCNACHIGPLFSDLSFHNTGISWGGEDLGRYETTHVDSDRGAFKTPSLRNVAETAPYMHDGSVATLDEVIERYDAGGNLNPYLDEEIQPLGLTPSEKHALIAFLQALSGCSTEVGAAVPACPGKWTRA